MSEQPDLSPPSEPEVPWGTTAEQMTTNMADVADMFAFEELDPELEAFHYISESTGWEVIKHPMVFSICHSPHQNKQMNKMLAYKREATTKALEAGEWHSFVFLHERPFRVDAFKRIAKRMSDEQYWDLLSEIWIDSENIRENPKVWQGLLRSKRPGREHMMSEEDRELLAQMDDTIAVFQGHTDERDDGWSWTIDRSKAEWFARRFADMEHADPVLSFGTCRRKDVIAFLTNRGESEILIPRSKVAIQGVQKVKRPQTTSTGEGAQVKHQSVADALLYINSTGSNTSFLKLDFN